MVDIEPVNTHFYHSSLRGLHWLGQRLTMSQFMSNQRTPAE